MLLKKRRSNALTRTLRQNMGMRRALALMLALLLTACSGASQQYPGSKKEGVFFTVPNDWKEISMERLQKFERSSTSSAVLNRAALVRYEVAYSPNGKLEPLDVFSQAETDQPVALLRVRDLSAEEVNAVSYNVLRSILFPIPQIVLQPQAGDPPFELIDDFEVADKGGRGVRTIYRITIDGVEQTVDQTAVTSNDHRILYAFIIRCSSACYKKNQKLMTKISDSFSIKGAR